MYHSDISISLYFKIFSSIVLFSYIQNLALISVGIVMDYGMGGQCSIPGRVKKLFSSAQRPERPCGPPRLISSGYWEVFSGSKADRA
jgi:hypothetical protein